MNAGLLIIDRLYTGDDVVPWFENGEEVGWRCIPVPPDYSDHWFIFDSRSDKRTGWRRIRWSAP